MEVNEKLKYSVEVLRDRIEGWRKATYMAQAAEGALVDSLLWGAPLEEAEAEMKAIDASVKASERLVFCAYGYVTRRYKSAINAIAAGHVAGDASLENAVAAYAEAAVLVREAKELYCSFKNPGWWTTPPERFTFEVEVTER